MKLNYLIILITILFFNPFKVESQDIDTLVDIGGNDMHFTIWKGEGIPIIFESGGGNDGTIWSQLIEVIYPIIGTTLITYDRRGYGRSELDTNLPDDKKSLINYGIEDLRIGLQKLGYDGEIILVAHSYGGFYASYFASKYPERVKGIVLIDANLICFYDDNYVKELKKERTLSWLNNIKSQSLAVYYECLSFYETIEKMRLISIPNAIPIIDLVSDNPPFSIESRNERWKSCHEVFVKQSSNRTGVVASDCGHYLHFDNSKLAVDAIIKMYCETNKGIDYETILKKSLDYSIESSNGYRQREYEYWHSERDINNWGYTLLNEEKLEDALKIFELNTILYPSSFNVWDSYGEMLLRLGEKTKAITMYQKSIELNPKNDNGKRILERLLKE